MEATSSGLPRRFSGMFPNKAFSFAGAVAKGHVRAFLGEALGDGQADALASSSNCSHFAIHPVCHYFLLPIGSCECDAASLVLFREGIPPPPRVVFCKECGSG